jgi:hypothetical protein
MKIKGHPLYHPYLVALARILRDNGRGHWDVWRKRPGQFWFFQHERLSGRSARPLDTKQMMFFQTCFRSMLVDPGRAPLYLMDPTTNQFSREWFRRHCAEAFLEVYHEDSQP